MESHVYMHASLDPVRVEVMKPGPATYEDGAVRVWFGEYSNAWLTLSPDDADALSLQLRAALLQLENYLELVQPSSQPRLPIKD